jgi:hypothetical protein
MPTREDLQKLVSTLPEDALDAAHAHLSRLQAGLPKVPDRAAASEHLQQMQARHRQRLEEIANRHPGQCGVSIGGGGFSSDARGRRRGRHGFSYEDGPDSVHETNIVHDDFAFTVIERIQRDAAARQVQFVIEITGPDGTTAHHVHRYQLP